MAKMAVLGEGDGILVFKAAGVDAYAADDEKKAKDILRSIAKEYSVIFITEELAQRLGDFLKRFDESAYPAIVAIPSGRDGSGYAMNALKAAGERALGVDILFKD